MIFSIICLGCSHRIQVLEIHEKQKNLITIKNLNLFKEREYINLTRINNRYFKTEIEYIKKITVRVNLMRSTIYNYAFVLEKDTIYASGNLKFWYYKGRVQMFNSKVINTESIENITNN
jgi:hypothetical protein